MNYFKKLPKLSPLGLVLVMATVFFSVGFVWEIYSYKTLAKNHLDQDLKVISQAELSKFDGTNSNLPIYIGMNGLVYDVSAGKEFYVTGGVYHYLAGRDSSKELNMVGGGIIKRKYPVVGRLAN